MPPRRSPVTGAKGAVKRQATAANRSPRPERTKAPHGCRGAGAGHPWGRVVEVSLMLAKGFLRDGWGGKNQHRWLDRTAVHNQGSPW